MNLFRGTHINAFILMIVVGLLLFGESIFFPGVPFPAHTDCFLPWRASLDEKEVADATSRLNRTVTDKNFSFHPDNMVTAEAFQKKRIPQWNPYQMAGFPHLAQSLYGVFYPLNLPLFFLGPDKWYTPITLLHYILAGFFTYLLLRRFGLSFGAAAAGGLIFICCANMTGRFHYYMTIYPMTWAPLILYLIHRFHKDRSYLSLTGVAIFAAMTILSGFQQMALYVFYLSMGFSLFLSAEGRFSIHWKRSLLLGVAITAVGLGLLFLFLKQMDYLAYWSFGILLWLFGFFLGGRGFFRWILASLPVGLALLFGIGLSTVQVLPVVEIMPHSARPAGLVPEIMVTTESLTSGGWMGFAMPFFLTDPMWSLADTAQNYGSTAFAWQVGHQGKTIIPNYVEWSLYMGILPLALMACLSFRQKGRRNFLFLGALALLFLSMAFGFWMTVYPAWFIGFQFDPKRLLLVFSFLASILAAYGLENVLSKETGSKKPLTLGIILLLVAVTAGATGAFFNHTLTDALYGMAKAKPDFADSIQPKELFPMEDMENQLHIRSVLLHLALAAALGGAALIRLAIKPNNAAQSLALIVILIDLVPLAWHVNAPQKAEGFLETDPAIAVMERTSEDDHFRIFRYTEKLESSALRVPMPGDMTTHFKIEDGEGYIVQPQKRYYALMNKMQPGIAQGVWILPLCNLKSLGSPILDLIGARYIMATAPLPQDSGFKEVYKKGDLMVYENEEAFPRAFLVQKAEFFTPDDTEALLDRMVAPETDLKSTVMLESESMAHAFGDGPIPTARVTYIHPEEVRITFDGPVPGGYLVLTDAFYPGWTAEVDQKPVPVMPANNAFRAVLLKEGDQEVVFRLDFPKIGVQISLIFAALLVLFSAVVAVIRLWPTREQVIEEDTIERESGVQGPIENYTIEEGSIEQDSTEQNPPVQNTD